FRDREPDARAGYSINLYHVTYPGEMPVERVVVNNGRSVSDIPRAELSHLPDSRLIVKWTRNPATEIWPQETAVLPPTLSPVQANFANVFQLIGYDTPQISWHPGDIFTATLYWQVGTAAMPMPAPAAAPPLAAFVHVTADGNPQPVAQFDGWDVAHTGLEPGDIIAQPITIPLPPGLPPGDYQLNVGLYSPQSGQRLLLADKSSDFITINAIHINK
ncbi:MAG: hypothetical protein KC421_14580, partial [Anaerolineales bacterium]|nr:hypothetical protein [Anaerolineales bacterium]